MKVIEYCEMCPLSETKRVLYTTSSVLYVCNQKNQEIPGELYEEGLIPSWCPLPKEK